MFLDK